MKDIIKTLIVSLIILVSLGVCFLLVSNVEQGIELLTRTELPLSDPDVKLLYRQIENNSDLRMAELDVNELKNSEILELVIDNLTKDDYTKKTVKAEKIDCEVTKKITFTTDTGKCKIRIINNDVFHKYLKKTFNVEKDIEFNSINYHGYNCKNSGKKYYCMYESYKNYVRGYSAFDKAYKTKDTIVISEYYLHVDVSNGERCSLYFDEQYCADYKEMDRKDISEDTIKRDGVLYEHVFKLVDGKYYLQKSYVKNEG